MKHADYLVGMSVLVDIVESTPMSDGIVVEELYVDEEIVLT